MLPKWQAQSNAPIVRWMQYAGFWTMRNEGSAVPDGILLRQRPVARGETIFRMEDPYRSIFAVKSGSFKTLIPTSDGRDQVIGFHLPGELIGAEGVAEGAYPNAPLVLWRQAVSVSCVWNACLRQGRPLEVLQQRIIGLLGKEVAFNRTLMASLIRQSAEQRIAAFLLNLSLEAWKIRGQVSQEFALSMSRTDIGSYLGLASETVSRVLARLQKSGLLTLEKKQVHLQAPDRLTEIAESISKLLVIDWYNGLLVR